MATEGSSVVRKKKRQAMALLDANRLHEAGDLLLQICHLEEGEPEHWMLAGVTMGRVGQMNQAASCFQKATMLRPDFPEAHYNLGKALKGLGRLEVAASSYEAALRLRPGWTDALLNLGNIFDLLGRLREAASCFQRMLEASPGHPAALKALGSALMSLGEFEEAMACFERLELMEPDNLDARIGKAKVLERRGDIGQASTILRPLVEAGTRNLELDLLYASMSEPRAAIALLEPWVAHVGKEIEQRPGASLHFRLGALHDGIGEYPKAFEHFRKANSFKANPFDLSAFSSFVDDIVSAFSVESMSIAPRATHGSERPVFILGMPRSGTTLVEQILCSHPDVFGGGELDDIRRISLEMLGADRGGRISSDSLAALDADSCNRHASGYLDRLDDLAGHSVHVTDKMPQNFIGVGVIALLFPNARIIHCRRDPIDTCLSCFFTDFGASHDYTGNFEILGGYYRQYRRLMDHWSDVLGIPMLEVDYETLVEDQESVTRSLLDYCGLEWDERCLHFHDNKRVVSTASYNQVRKPIYSQSVGRWRHYRPYLSPLIESLGGG